MSALGQKQTLQQVGGMSALPPEANMCDAKTDVRLVRLFDHLVGAEENRLRDVNIECFGRFRIYDQFELRWPFDRKGGRVVAFENAIDIVGKSPIALRKTRSINAKCTALCKDSPCKDYRHTTGHCEIYNFLAVLNGKCVGENRNRLHWNRR